ncbi:hypothetical protein [Pseudomonas sp. fls2-241-R2A-110]|uniref:hypothetical protein n=1 Tax=Pseudomonas sp. fls2-241-R2A-110 TaxID=3040311 RepID=UPI002555FA92|nr:hypothetical protein [Pseudomonas sp. fls2-241-R2A-110]
MAAVTDVSVEDAIDFFAMKISEFKAQYLKLRAKQSVCQPNLPKTHTTFTIHDPAHSDGSVAAQFESREGIYVSDGRSGPSCEISLIPGAAAMTSGMRFTMQKRRRPLAGLHPCRRERDAKQARRKLRLAPKKTGRRAPLFYENRQIEG